MTTPAAPAAPAEGAPLTVRRLHVDLERGFGRHWCGGNAFMTAYLNALSMSFPVGEQFFIDSVRNGIDKLPADLPAAERESWQTLAKGFIGQEATHRRLHALMNAELARQGLVNTWEERGRARIAATRARLVGKSYTHLVELAITAAYEHYTAVLAEELLLGREDQPGDWFADAEPVMRVFWRWHAAEESEHKSVAFDLYQRLGGATRHRVRAFALVSVFFALDATRQTVRNLHEDGTLWKLSTWRQALAFVIGRHGALWRVARPLAQYLRADFHPSRVGSGQAAQRWLAAHAGEWTPVGAASTPAARAAVNALPP